jgi:hypothetical protein
MLNQDLFIRILLISMILKVVIIVVGTVNNLFFFLTLCGYFIRQEFPKLPNRIG